MAPPKRSAQEANLLDDSNPIAKQKLVAQAQLAGRGRRTGNANAAGSAAVAAAAAAAAANKSSSLANLAELANASESARQTQANGAGSFDWQNEDRDVLTRYRDAFRLPVGTPFHNPSAHYVLAMGIGPMSPTMARQTQKSRVPREQLATAVRRHFKEAPVNETECLVELMYRIRNKDKAFRHKFPVKPAK